MLGCFAKNLPNMTRLWGFQTPEFLGNGTYELLQAGVSKNKSLTYMALEGKEYTTFKPYMKRNKLIQEAVNIVASLSGRGCPGVAPLALVKLGKVAVSVTGRTGAAASDHGVSAMYTIVNGFKNEFFSVPLENKRKHRSGGTS